MPSTKILSVASYLPPRRIVTQEIEEMISRTYPEVQSGLIETMTGVQERRWRDEGIYCSDLAIEAAKKCLEQTTVQKEEIDLLIFASASQDIIEPATANIVQQGLGLTCPVFDIKNACNSFMNAIDVADAYITSGKYRTILICSGETPSQVVKVDVESRVEFKHYFAGYTLGDAGASMLLQATDDQSGIQASLFYSDGSTWDLVTILGGGSRSPRFPDDVYFCGDPGKIRDKFISIGADEFHAGLQKLGWQPDQLKKIYVHQVAMKNFDYMQEILGVDASVFTIILPELGNIASCCIPTALARDREQGVFESGDKVVCIGFASGFSYGLLYYEW